MQVPHRTHGQGAPDRCTRSRAAVRAVSSAHRQVRMRSRGSAAMKTFTRVAALAGSAVVLSGAAALAGSGAAYAAAGCRMYFNVASFSPFSGTIDIVNTGDPITGGWALTFTFTAGQRITSGWPVTFTQPVGSGTVTVASNAPWNSSLATGVPFHTGFLGTSQPIVSPPTAVALNGTVCRV
ncbi:cellulose binding domain-containing protein [Dactylosporangium sp. CS-033363]|uniref:cellulose binding domain-containing protein n=1 Tax=Dactylosporangium sp. CS-033363 TaxID=3239935 RepID=UPI003D8F47DB